MKRTPIKTKIVRNKLLRKRVFERDEGYCCDCRKFDPKWEHDHDLPLSMGGRDTLENSKTRCRACHRKKTDREAPVRAKSNRIQARHAQFLERRSLLRPTP